MGSLLKVISNGTLLAWGDELIENILDTIWSVVGATLWLLCDLFFVILDLFEIFFKIFAGGGELVQNAYGEEVKGDLVLYLINSSLVQQIFFSILTLSFFLLIIFTIFALVKNIYAEKQEPISKIINASVKAMLLYLLVPVATIVCLLVGEVVLTAVDGATSETSGSVTASTMLFTASAYNANRLRDEDINDSRDSLANLIDSEALDKMGIRGEIAALGVTDETSARSASPETIEKIAQLIDSTMYVHGWANWARIAQFYNPSQISFLTVWIGGAFLIWSIGKITWGLASRMFKMTLYFAISPAVMATFPLDNGNALTQWRGEMVKLGTMTIVTIGVMNVFYSILPIIDELHLFGNNIVSNGTINNISRIMLAIIGFSSAQSLISSISGWFKTGDALKAGIEAKGQYKNATKKLAAGATKAIGMFGGIRGGWKAATDQGATKFKDKLMGSMQGLYKTSGLSKAQEEVQKAFQGGKKSAEERYKDYKTKGRFSGNVNKDAEAEWNARETIKKEKESYETQKAGLDASKKVEYDYIKQLRTDNKLTNEQYVEMHKEITERYNKADKQLKASMEFVKALTESDAKVVETLEKVVEKRAKSFNPVDSLKKAGDSSTLLMEQVIAQTGASKANIEANWQDILKGRFTGVDKGFQKAVRDAYKSMSSEFLSVNRELKQAQEEIEYAFKAGDTTYLKGVFGKDFDGQIKNVTAAIARAQNEAEEFAKAQEDLKARQKDLLDKQKNAYDTVGSLDSKAITDIGKKLGKK